MHQTHSLGCQPCTGKPAEHAAAKPGPRQRKAGRSVAQRAQQGSLLRVICHHGIHRRIQHGPHHARCVGGPGVHLLARRVHALWGSVSVRVGGSGVGWTEVLLRLAASEVRSVGNRSMLHAAGEQGGKDNDGGEGGEGRVAWSSGCK